MSDITPTAVFRPYLVVLAATGVLAALGCLFVATVAAS